MNPCLNNGRCMPDGMGGFKCLCSQEFTGPKCEQSKLFRLVDQKLLHIQNIRITMCEQPMSKWRYLCSYRFWLPMRLPDGSNRIQL
jgi:hypothetical protein